MLKLVSQAILYLDKRALFRRTLSPAVQLTEVDVSVRDLPAELVGFRIVQISDFHVGHNGWHPVHLDDVKQLVREARPDVVVNTGDYLQGEPAIDTVLDVARKMTWMDDAAAGNPPLVSILGNHDYYAGNGKNDGLKAGLDLMNLRLLVNSATCIRRGGRGVSLVNISDYEPGFERGVEALLAAGRPRVALIHEPDLIEQMPPGSADLVLAGHTHGGQVTVPGLERYIVKFFCGSDYVEGFYTVNDMLMYVNRGLGCTGLPVRFRATPEVTLIRLTR